MSEEHLETMAAQFCRVGDAQPDEADQQALAQHDGQGDGDGAAEQVAHDSFLGQAAEDVVP